MNTDFKTILKRISPTLKRITYKLNGHFSYFNDEDLFQEALIFLWQGLGSGKLSDKTDSYILQGCYFYLKNYIRKSAAGAKLVNLEDLLAEYEQGAYFEDTTFFQDNASLDTRHYLDNKMLVEAMLNNGLSKREKEILLLFREGLTTREIGKRLGVSHVTVVKISAKIRRQYNYLNP